MLSTAWVSEGHGATINDLRKRLGYLLIESEEGAFRTNLEIVRDVERFGDYDSDRAVVAIKEARARFAFGINLSLSGSLKAMKS